MKNSACKQQMFPLKQKQKEGNWDCFVAFYKILYYHKNPNLKKKNQHKQEIKWDYWIRM